jgi:broad specificity phosphatase PhoE
MGDPGLTAEGRAEVVALAASLVSRPVVAVFTSPLRRARETAEIIGQAVGLEVRVDPHLRERMNWGDIADQSFEAFVAVWERCCREREFQPVGGDSSRVAGDRLEAFVRAVASGVSVGEVLAVCHGGLIADFLLNVFSPAELELVSSPFVIDPYSAEVMRECSVTTVEVEGDQFSLRAVGAYPPGWVRG